MVYAILRAKDIYLDVHTLGMVLGISKKLGFHASRHTFGVLMLNEDIPIGSIAKMLGFTVTVYDDCAYKLAVIIKAAVRLKMDVFFIC